MLRALRHSDPAWRAGVFSGMLGGAAAALTAAGAGVLVGAAGTWALDRFSDMKSDEVDRAQLRALGTPRGLMRSLGPYAGAGAVALVGGGAFTKLAKGRWAGRFMGDLGILTGRMAGAMGLIGVASAGLILGATKVLSGEEPPTPNETPAPEVPVANG